MLPASTYPLCHEFVIRHCAPATVSSCRRVDPTRLPSWSLSVPNIAIFLAAIQLRDFMYAGDQQLCVQNEPKIGMPPGQRRAVDLFTWACPVSPCTFTQQQSKVGRTECCGSAAAGKKAIFLVPSCILYRDGKILHGGMCICHEHVPDIHVGRRNHAHDSRIFGEEQRKCRVPR